MGLGQLGGRGLQGSRGLRGRHLGSHWGVVGHPGLASWVAPLHQEVVEGGRGWPAVGVAEGVMQLRRGRLLGCTRGSRLHRGTTHQDNQGERAWTGAILWLYYNQAG